MNIISKNNKIYKLESYWRNSKKEKKIDSKGRLFPYPRIGTKWTSQVVFKNRLIKVQKILKKFGKYKNKNHKDCLIW